MDDRMSADTTPSSEQLTSLLEVQAIDDEVRRLEHQLAELPEQRTVDELGTERAALTTRVQEVEERMARAAREQRQVEGEIEGLTLRHTEEQARLYAGTLSSAREIQAAEAEIASTARRRGEHEDQLLEVMQVVEDLGAELATLAEARAELDAAIAVASEARDAAAQTLLVSIAEVRVRRDPIAAKLPSDLLDAYEQAALRGGGTGVGVLRGDACSACRITFPMSEINTFLTGPPLTRCTQCRRLLIVPA
jgi:predicted  nucleic acid-binding Zn-ribbon protein